VFLARLPACRMRCSPRPSFSLVSRDELDRIVDDYAGAATPEFAQIVLDGGR